MSEQVGGTHYQGTDVQPVELAEKFGLGFCAGSVLKYLYRYKRKNGLEDLKKAMHYCSLAVQHPLVFCIDAAVTGRLTFAELLKEACAAIDQWDALPEVKDVSKTMLQECALCASEEVWKHIETKIDEIIKLEYPDAE